MFSLPSRRWILKSLMVVHDRTFNGFESNAMKRLVHGHPTTFFP